MSMATSKQWLWWMSFLKKYNYPVRVIEAAEKEMAIDLAKDRKE